MKLSSGKTHGVYVGFTSRIWACAQYFLHFTIPEVIPVPSHILEAELVQAYENLAY